MKVQVGPIWVELIERGDRICAHMREKGSFEPETLAVWGELCAKAVERTVVDVGSYSGLFAIAGALLGAKSVAFEPLPLNRKRIVNNCHENGGQGTRDKVKLYQVALSDKPGTMPLYYNAHTTGLTSGASIVNDKLGAMPISRMDVEVRTLDSYELQDVAAIKIDVERAEPEVLRGARETLKRCKPTLIVEVLGGDEEAAVMAALDGYRVQRRLDKRNGRPANWLMTPIN